LNSLQKEHQELDQKARKAMRGLRKYKQESEKISRHNELLQRELSRLNGNAQQRSRKIDTLESRQESSREALLVANQRIDQLTEAVKRQEGMIERSRKLRQKEQADLKRFGAAPAIIKILPAIDSFELALTQSTDDADTLQEGLGIALKQFHGTLDSIGVSKIKSGRGVLFDPNYHEAVMRIPSEEVPHNHILECFCDAYIMNGRLLRAAKVSVAMSSEN
jgi:molecular chaperone GrpE